MGKTTLAKNLFASYCREGDPDIEDGPHTVAEFIEAAEVGCTEIEVQVQPEESETITSFHYVIQVSYLSFIRPSYVTLLVLADKRASQFGYDTQAMQHDLSVCAMQGACDLLQSACMELLPGTAVLSTVGHGKAVPDAHPSLASLFGELRDDQLVVCTFLDAAWASLCSLSK